MGQVSGRLSLQSKTRFIPSKLLHFHRTIMMRRSDRLLSKQFNGRLVDALELLSEVNSEFDVVGSVLPFGLKSDRHLEGGDYVRRKN